MIIKPILLFEKGIVDLESGVVHLSSYFRILFATRLQVYLSSRVREKVSESSSDL